MGFMFSHAVTQSCKSFLQAMLDVLEHGDEGREQDMYCGDGKKGKKLSSSSCSKGCEVQVQELSVALKPRPGLCPDMPG